MAVKANQETTNEVLGESNESIEVDVDGILDEEEAEMEKKSIYELLEEDIIE